MTDNSQSPPPFSQWTREDCAHWGVGEQLISATVSGPVSKTQEVLKWKCRPVEIGGKLQHQWTAITKRQEHHENHSLAPSALHFLKLTEQSYRNAHIRTTHYEMNLRCSKKGKWLISIKSLQNSESLPVVKTHNREKQMLLPEGQPVPFLVELGVMRADGQVPKSRMKKFRQINHLLQFVDQVYEELPTERAISVIDYGCGRSYLTFAVHYYLTALKNRTVAIQGYDQRTDVINECQGLVEKLGLEGLSFQTMSIAELPEQGELDLAIWLHACDTATDDAIAVSVARQASLILAVPCCQHELSGQLQQTTLMPWTSQGLLRERFAALATDTYRMLWLEQLGYQTQMLEFIETEHTPKNLLLRAVKAKGASDHKQQPLPEQKQSPQEFAESIGWKSPYLEKRLAECGIL